MKDQAPRILAGAFKGRPLLVPRGRATRPLRALARRSLFDMLAPELEGAVFLDLFAGSGAVGFEALSRGAARAVLVDAGRPALDAMRRTATAFGAQGAEVHGGDALAFLRSPAARSCFDLAFLGPPYPLYRERRDYLSEVFDALPAVLRPGGLVVLESPDDVRPPAVPGLASERERRYGESVLGFHRLPAEE